MFNPILLMEGLDAGDAASLKYITESGESLSRTVLTDRAKFINESGEEKKDPKILFIEGVFQRADTKNANGRIYPRKLWERILSEDSSAMQTMKQGSMGGHMEHPVDGIPDLNKTAIRIVSMKLEEDGRVLGRAQIMDTHCGKDARALVEGGFLVGISSRGRGSLGPGNIVSDDYQLATFDLVSKPSTSGAYPTKPSDAKNESITESARQNTAVSKTQEPSMFNFVKFEASAKPLVEQDLTGIAAYQISDLEGRILNAIEEGIAAVKSDSSVTSLVNPLIESLNKKRAEINGRGAAEVSALKEALADMTKQRDAAIGLCESLTVEFSARIEALMESVTEKDTSSTEGKDDETKEDSADMAEALAEALELGEALREERDFISAKYESSITVIQKLVAPKKTTAVQESVAGLIAKHPVLSESKDLLESQESVEKAQEVAESIIKAKKTDNKGETRPHGLVVESTDDDSSKSGLSESAEKKSTGPLPKCLRLLA
jgi:hypothetical protein